MELNEVALKQLKTTLVKHVAGIEDYILEQENSPQVEIDTLPLCTSKSTFDIDSLADSLLTLHCFRYSAAVGGLSWSFKNESFSTFSEKYSGLVAVGEQDSPVVSKLEMKEWLFAQLF